MKNQILSMLPWKPIAIGATALLSSLSTANAVINIDVSEVGGSLHIHVTGSVDTGGATPNVVSFVGNHVARRTTSYFLASSTTNTSQILDLYPVSNLARSGTVTDDTTAVSNSDSSGDRFVVGVFSAQVAVPAGYITGSSIDVSATFANTTFSTLGLTAGDTGAMTFDIGSNIGESVVITAVPEYGFFGVVLGSCALTMGLRRRDLKK